MAMGRPKATVTVQCRTLTTDDITAAKSCCRAWARQSMRRYKKGEISDVKLLESVEEYKTDKFKGLTAKTYNMGKKRILTAVEISKVNGKSMSTTRRYLARMQNGEITPGQVLGEEPMSIIKSGLHERNQTEDERASRILASIPSPGSWEKENIDCRGVGA